MIMQEMIELFLTQLVDARSELDVLVNSKNWFELSRLAHKIKSSALVMGAEQIFIDMKELELSAKESKNTEKYPAIIERLKTKFELVEMELRPFLGSCQQIDN